MSNENSLQSVRKVTQQDFIESILNLLFHYLHIVYMYMYTIHTIIQVKDRLYMYFCGYKISFKIITKTMTISFLFINYTRNYYL